MNRPLCSVFTGPCVQLSFCKKCLLTKYANKKVLRERKRHTDRRVASARYAALSPNEGTPLPPSVQTWDGPTPIWTWNGVPTIQTRDVVAPPHPNLEMGYPLSPSRPWNGVPAPPPRQCGQTENITFPHHSDAGGKNGVHSYLDDQPDNYIKQMEILLMGVKSSDSFFVFVLFLFLVSFSFKVSHTKAITLFHLFFVPKNPAIFFMRRKFFKCIFW